MTTEDAVPRPRPARGDAPVRVLFVCMGNICRSPTAEGVLRAALGEACLPFKVTVDSAGTHDYHIGKPPDRRTIAAAARRGIDLSGLRARQLAVTDFTDFDLLLVMDEDNLADVLERAPVSARGKVRLFLDYAHSGEREVPDPYYDGADAFERVLDLSEAGARGLLEALRRGEPAPR